MIWSTYLEKTLGIHKLLDWKSRIFDIDIWYKNFNFSKHTVFLFSGLIHHDILNDTMDNDYHNPYDHRMVMKPPNSSDSDHQSNHYEAPSCLVRNPSGSLFIPSSGKSLFYSYFRYVFKLWLASVSSCFDSIFPILDFRGTLEGEISMGFFWS